MSNNGRESERCIVAVEVFGISPLQPPLSMPVHETFPWLLTFVPKLAIVLFSQECP